MLHIIHGLVLGAVQGVTEFFPVSSSGHLILVPVLLGWEDQGILFDTILHLGTLAALVWVFWKDIVSVFSGTFVRKDAMARRELLMVIAASIPGLAFGALCGDWIEEVFRGPNPVVIGLVGWGIVLWIADRYAATHRAKTLETRKMSWWQAMAIGCSQAIALFPGTSRSGITMTSGLFSGLDRKTAVRFSFLVSIPTVAAAGGYGILQLAKNGLGPVSLFEIIVGFCSAALAGAWAIRFLRSYVETHSFTPFVIYRFALAAAVLLLV